MGHFSLLLCVPYDVLCLVVVHFALTWCCAAIFLKHIIRTLIGFMHMQEWGMQECLQVGASLFE